MSDWIRVRDRMPPAGQIVLATYVNELGKPRIIRAEWITRFTVEAENDFDDIGEYNEDEDDDTLYLPESWWEQIDNWAEYSMVNVTEGDVTHWMPLPLPPGEAEAGVAAMEEEI